MTDHYSMAILLAINQEHHREIIRQMLTMEFGFKKIIEASTSEKAAKAVSEFHNSLKLILVEEESHFHGMEGFFSCIEDHPSLGLPPVIMVGDQIPKIIPKRIDSFIKRPFSAKTLERAFYQAMKNRSQYRNRILLIGEHNEKDATTDSMIIHSEDWWKVIKVSNLKAFEKAVSENEKSIGAVIVDVRTKPWLTPERLQFFKKTSYGSFAEIFAVGSAVSDFLPIRTLVTGTILAELTGPLSDKIYKRAARAIESCFEIKHLISIIKNNSTEQKNKRSIKQAIKNQMSIAKKMIASSPNCYEALCKKGDLHYQLKDYSSAQFFYIAAISSNGCSPNAFVKLLQLFKHLNQEQNFLKTLELALEYCPDVPELLQLKKKNNVVNLEDVKKIKEAA